MMSKLIRLLNEKDKNEKKLFNASPRFGYLT